MERELSSSPHQVGYAWRLFGVIEGLSSSRAEQKLRGPILVRPPGWSANFLVRPFR